VNAVSRRRRPWADAEWDRWRGAIAIGLRPTRRNLLHWFSWVVALGVELALVAVLWGGEIYAWEQSLTRWFQDVPGRMIIFDVSSTLTNTISAPFLAIFVAVIAVAVHLGQRDAAWLLFLTFPLHVLALFPKALVDRPRPSAAFEGIVGVGGPRSFPSGHAEYVITFYGFIAYLLMRRLSAPWWRAVIVVVWLVLVLATGFGRVAAGRHWPFDVLAAYVVGLGLLSGMIWLYNAIRATGIDRDSSSHMVGKSGFMVK
jgi:membrane-associated phospholipid phosphatase